MSPRNGRNQGRNEQGKGGNSGENGQGAPRQGAAVRKGTLPASPREIAKEIPETLAEATQAAGGSIPKSGAAPAGTTALDVMKLWEDVAQIREAFTDGRSGWPPGRSNLATGNLSSPRQRAHRSNGSDRRAGCDPARLLEGRLARERRKSRSCRRGGGRKKGVGAPTGRAAEKNSTERAEVTAERARIRERDIELTCCRRMPRTPSSCMTGGPRTRSPGKSSSISSGWD